MEENLTDAQQVELLKKLWKEYGVAITLGTLLAITIALGWRFYQQHTIRQAERASLIYERMIVDIMGRHTQEAKKESDVLMHQFPRTPYATLSALTLAKLAVEQKKFDLATENLQWVIKHSHNKDFRQIARLRLARIYLAQKQTQAALKILEKTDSDSFTGLTLEITGDVYVALGQKEKAKTLYQTALDKLPDQAIMRPLLQMKLDNLK